MSSVVTAAAEAPLGQVFTPPAVADLTLALALGGDTAFARVLDPACGDGVFLARALAAGVAAARLSGVEIDPVAAAAAQRALPGVRVERRDFFEVAPPSPGAAFDAVVGNPPYVRQEALGDARKQRVATRVQHDWPDAAWPLRADLAAAFVARALRFVRPGGKVAFVLSTAALDAGYGEALRGFLHGRAHVLAVVVSPRERWFAEAQIHAAIVVLERVAESSSPPPPARFARLRVPVAEAAARVASLADLDAVADVRLAAAGDSWPSLLRAPDAWFAARAAAGDALVPLAQVAELWRGATSGANEFFYLTRAQAAARGVERAFLRPVLRTPRAATAIRVDPAALPTLAFVCDLDEAALARHPGAAAHVRAHAALATRPTLAVRQRWWQLSARPAQAFLTKAYDVRFVQPYAPEPLCADQRVYALAPWPGCGDAEMLAAILNGTLTALALESLGRASMGQGALEWSVGDAQTLPVLDPRRVDALKVRKAFRQLASRTVGPVAAEAAAADRLALDEALTAHLPALAAQLPAIHAALVASVADRRERSR
jgi:hypothetical protein